jgi:hypothetical protein
MVTGNHTRVDNVFVAAPILNNLVSCDTAPGDRPMKTDHYPIDTVLELTMASASDTPKYNFRQVDWGNYNRKLKDELKQTGWTTEPGSAQEFTEALDALTGTIVRATEELVPKTRPSPYMKRWWLLELTQIRSEVRQLGRQAYKRRNDPANPAHEAYRSKRNTYANAIEKSKREHWENFLEGIDQKTVWTAHRYASADTTDGGCTRVPTLKQVRADGSILTAETNTDKAAMLYSTFFPKPGNEGEAIPAHFQYPTPAFDYQPITDAQIRRAINKLNSFKAPGANGIPNIVWKQCANVLLPYIGPLFRSTFTLQIYPTQWKDSITKVLRKPGKADYTAPGAY